MIKKDVLEIIITAVIIAVFSFILGYASGRHSVKQTSNTTPVKEMRYIDTLYINNEIIKYKVKYLDSIRYEKVYEVRALDDSATVRLFYELCSK